MTIVQWLIISIKTIVAAFIAALSGLLAGILLVDNIPFPWPVISGIAIFTWIGYHLLPYEAKKGIEYWNKPKEKIYTNQQVIDIIREQAINIFTYLNPKLADDKDFIDLLKREIEANPNTPYYEVMENTRIKFLSKKGVK